MTADYEVRLTRLLNDFRDRIGVPDLVILLGIDEQHPWVKERPEVVSIQKELAQKEQGMVFVSMIGLPKADTSHLTPAGLVDHGERLFEAYEEAILERD